MQTDIDPTQPHIVSAVNGMKIPLAKGHVGVMWRFEHPENRVTIAKVNSAGAEVVRDDGSRMVLESETRASDIPTL